MQNNWKLILINQLQKPAASAAKQNMDIICE